MKHNICAAFRFSLNLLFQPYRAIKFLTADENTKNRFSVFGGLFKKGDVYVLRLEDLISKSRETAWINISKHCTKFYSEWENTIFLVERLISGMGPGRSHIFYKEKIRVWRDVFTQGRCR